MGCKRLGYNCIENNIKLKYSRNLEEIMSYSSPLLILLTKLIKNVKKGNDENSIKNDLLIQNFLNISENCLYELNSMP